MLDEKTLEQQDEEKEYQNNFKPREVKLKDDYPFYNHNFFFVLCSKIVIILTIIGCFFAKHILWGYKQTGKKNIKGIKGISFNTNPANDNIAIIQLMQQQHDQIHMDMVQQHIQDVLNNQNLDSLSSQLQMDTINANNIAISMAHPIHM